MKATLITIGKELKEKGFTLSIAESCTGGLTSHLITNVPGASNYFIGGVISYSNEMKRKILNVPGSLLKKYGAVSESVAKKMAEGIRDLTKTNLGIGITGIAGPGNYPKGRVRKKNKPVGLVYVALATPGRTLVEKFNFHGEREEIKKRTTQAALFMLLRYLRSGGKDGF